MMVGPVEYSNQTASATIKLGPGSLMGVVLMAGSDTATVTVYDNTAGSGNIVLKLSAVTGTSEPAIIPNGVAFSVGLHVVMTGTGESVSVFYV